MNTSHIPLLQKLFQEWSGEVVQHIEALPQSGSSRQYFRIQGVTRKALGVYNSEKKENTAYLGFTKHFLNQLLPVPSLLAEDLDHNVYLVSDHGDETLFSWLNKNRSGKEISEKAISFYKKALTDLAKFQVVGGKGLDYSLCYPRSDFDKQALMWDLHYFKYYFLKLANIPFDEQELEDDFNQLVDFLLTADQHYFVYRDFQARNIIFQDEKLYYVDFQGGRRGSLHYDVASLLYQAKAALPQSVKEELVDHYLSAVNQHITVCKEAFLDHYYSYVIIRTLQSMGAYGFRGFYERKSHFLTSIPFILDNLAWILQNIHLPIQLPHLWKVLHLLIDSPTLKKYKNMDASTAPLQITINSFSFHNGMPADPEHGGGHVFDCRALQNPGRYDEYKTLNGKDKEVIEFFKKEPEISTFLDNVYAIVDQSVDKYLERKFTNLQVSFGCTGGQHRSVYCAEKLAVHLAEKYKVRMKIHHIEQNNK